MGRKRREGGEEGERGWEGRRRPRRRVKARGVEEEEETRGKDEDENIPCLKNPQLCVRCLMLCMSVEPEECTRVLQ